MGTNDRYKETLGCLPEGTNLDDCPFVSFSFPKKQNPPKMLKKTGTPIVIEDKTNGRKFCFDFGKTELKGLYIKEKVDGKWCEWKKVEHRVHISMEESQHLTEKEILKKLANVFLKKQV